MDGDRGSTYTVAHAIDTLGFGKFQVKFAAHVLSFYKNVKLMKMPFLLSGYYLQPWVVQTLQMRWK